MQLFSCPKGIAVPVRWVFALALLLTTVVDAQAQGRINLLLDRSRVAPGGSANIIPLLLGGSVQVEDYRWSLSPAMGSISAVSSRQFLYTAPSYVPATVRIQITLNAAGLTAPAVTYLQLEASTAPPVAPPPPPPPPPPPEPVVSPPPPVVSPPVVAAPVATAISLPIEVLGAANTIKTVTFDVNSSQASGAVKLFLRIHGLAFVGQASIQINNQPWVDLTDSSLQLNTLDSAYGGIGGGFPTIRGTLGLSPGAIVTGTNTLRFRFNRTDGFTQGFRVLAFNLKDGSNGDLLAQSAFTQDNPATWTAPISGNAAIAAGRNLWYNANLSSPLSGSLRAKCTDCHTQDGRDLKYFNYSNFSIRSRAQFHGLSETEGDQIASYIRSLNVINPGRPWNPPYQPGPGIDAKPVSEWAAGAGLDAVLDRDRDMIPIIFPNGINTTNIRSQGDLSARSTPIAMQLPDWNHWLPQIHPKDAYTGFEASTAYTWYQDLRRMLVPNSVSSFLSIREIFQFWPIRRGEFFGARESTLGPWSETRVRTVYSSQLWALVKNWELNQEFGLEAMSRAWHGAQADDRAWTNSEAFQTSPHKLNLPIEIPGVRNGKRSTQTYTSFVWYHLQLILNNSNKHQDASFPIDWPYSYAFIKDMTDFAPQAGILTLWTTKGLQISETGVPPGGGQYEWNMQFANVTQTVHIDTKKAWLDLPPAERNLVLEALLRAWLDKAKTFTPQQFYNGGQSYYDIPHTLNAFDGTPASRFWFMLIQMKGYGVRQDYLDDAAGWAQTLWPTFLWSSIVR